MKRWLVTIFIIHRNRVIDRRYIAVDARDANSARNKALAQAKKDLKESTCVPLVNYVEDVSHGKEFRESVYRLECELKNAIGKIKTLERELYYAHQQIIALDELERATFKHVGY